MPYIDGVNTCILDCWNVELGSSRKIAHLLPLSIFLEPTHRTEVSRALKLYPLYLQQMPNQCICSLLLEVKLREKKNREKKLACKFEWFHHNAYISYRRNISLLSFLLPIYYGIFGREFTKRELKKNINLNLWRKILLTTRLFFIWMNSDEEIQMLIRYLRRLTNYKKLFT